MAGSKPAASGATASADLRQWALDDADLERILDPKRLDAVLERLASALGWSVVRPGTTVEPRLVPNALLQRLLVPALLTAAGSDHDSSALVGRPLLWDTGSDQLLLHLAEASLVTGDGFVDLHLLVECDETGRAEVVATYLTASAERPHGFVLATEERPRGPRIVVEVWGEALVALGWRTLVEVAQMVASIRGVNTSDDPLVASTVVAHPEGLVITAMGSHRFGSGIGGRR